MAVKEAYTTQDLVPLLKVSRQAIEKRIAREKWQARERARCGSREWLVSSMPEETRVAIRAAEEKQALALCPAPAPIPALSPSTTTAIMDDKRRYKALARADLVCQYLTWQRRHGATKVQKGEFIIAYKAGAWPKLLEEVGPVSWQTLERWKLEQERAGSVLALADRRGVTHKGKTMLTEEHKRVILGHVLNPNGAKVSQCVREVQKKFQAAGMALPSEPTIRRFVKHYMEECFDEWTLFREGKKAWNDKCAISLLRDWSLVGVGDVIIGDGHTLNFETLNPATGKPTRMTIVLFYDGASNCPLGWEIMPTENTDSISAAFRRSCIMLGKFPRVVYLDNGRAFRAKYFKGCPDFEQAGFLGLYRDLGCSVIHAWPYHGQSKPIERFFGTFHDMEVWMPSYTGNDIAHKPARMKRGEDLHRQLYTKMGGRPLTMEETLVQVARWFAEYATRPQYRTHLHGRTPGDVFMEGRGEGLSPQDMQKLTLFMMQKEVRTITKDGIKVNGRLYWHEKLYSRRHPVLVRYDEHFNPYSVYVYTLDGEPLCEAKDREHYRIASGLHPVARILGTAEQQEELRANIELRKGLERSSTALMRGLLQGSILPETQARMAALETETAEAVPDTPKKPKVIRLNTPSVSPEEEAALEQAKEKARAEMESAPSYTPSDLMRWKDSQARYGYLFEVKFEQGLELVPADAAWMEAYESTPEFERYLKNRYAALREMYEHKQAIQSA
ncbi:Mu transposase C-terminal domain-containing protein [uncultured Desulfovibrio sp.]|uniref:Mu transposase C-terminal domain-containing protein n=1 Tax=uncultured Desulfovibrio sp. TaxID=167968 RepID=UPI00265D4188|nr:Mu transposase C-terminal domain-containing protein [uncultured Desulfovibrio sp.]